MTTTTLAPCPPATPAPPLPLRTTTPHSKGYPQPPPQQQQLARRVNTREADPQLPGLAELGSSRRGQLRLYSSFLRGDPARSSTHRFNPGDTDTAYTQQESRFANRIAYTDQRLSGRETRHADTERSEDNSSTNSDDSEAERSALPDDAQLEDSDSAERHYQDPAEEGQEQVPAETAESRLGLPNAGEFFPLLYEDDFDPKEVDTAALSAALQRLLELPGGESVFTPTQFRRIVDLMRRESAYDYQDDVGAEEQQEKEAAPEEVVLGRQTYNAPAQG